MKRGEDGIHAVVGVRFCFNQELAEILVEKRTLFRHCAGPCHKTKSSVVSSSSVVFGDERDKSEEEC